MKQLREAHEDLYEAVLRIDELLAERDSLREALSVSPRGYKRGHLIVWDGATWRYRDGVVADRDRACVTCNQYPTPEGYDACLGFLRGVSSACCGHGVEEPYMVTA